MGAIMDYSQVIADPVRGPEIGRLYTEASPFITTLARHAYESFARQVETQYRIMTEVHGIRVHFEDDDPYTGRDAHLAMFEDVRCGLLRIYGTTPGQTHPILTPDQNNQFRAVHDFHGHFMTGRGFDRHGEEAAWVRHSQMFTGLARRAMTTETRGQNSAFIWINEGREFPPQKAVLLPDWVSRIPERWSH